MTLLAVPLGLLAFAVGLQACAESGRLIGTCTRDEDCSQGVCSAGRCEAVDTTPFDVSDADPADGPDDATSDRGPLEVNPLDGSDEEIAQPGGFEAACTANRDCQSTYCIDGDEGRFCTQLCFEDCPEGYDCRVLANTGQDAVRLCVPHRDVLCKPCTNHTQCEGFGAFCLEQDDGSFCATDCSITRECPEHYVCNVIVLGGAGDDGDDLVTRLCEPEVPACSGCLDGDGDRYGVGWGCLGSDCNDSEGGIHPGATELCNQIDDNCANGADETFDFESSLQHCGVCNRLCAPELHEVVDCVAGGCRRNCEPGWFNFDPEVAGCESPCTPNPDTLGIEECNFVDDDCNGVTDDGFDVQSDPVWCGDCTPCDLPRTSTHLCSAGICRPETCEAGWRHCTTTPESGCETDIWNDVANCGDCDDACLLTQAIAGCDSGICVIEACSSARYDDCNDIDSDGCEIDLWSHLSHCGECDTPCSFPGALASCSETGCAMGECLPQYYNLDEAAPGCEYGPCPGSPTSADLPSAPGTPLLTADADCDGIDGDIGAAVFVSPSGSNGSPDCAFERPCQTLERALLVARSRGVRQVLVRAGVYNEIVVLSALDNGIGIYGGYDSQWRRGDHRSAPYETSIVGGYRSADAQYMTVRARAVAATFDNLELVGADAALRANTGHGLSSYVVHADDSTLTFTNVTFDQGNGYSGNIGSPGTSASGTRPTRAVAGANSSTYATSCGVNNGASGGAGRQNDSCGSPSNTRGGDGGRGGSMDQCCDCVTWPTTVCQCTTCNCDATNGWTGSWANFAPSSFGWGGGGGSGGSCQAGSIGGAGRPGANGGGGSAGDDLGFVYGGLWWAAQNGGSGFLGADGTGGGGGGGGGGCDSGTDSSGAGGGGGGAGGCRATVAGTGGIGGGGSFGVFAVDSTISVTGSTFRRGNGGAGGRGGNGGSGQPGGLGGLAGQGSGPNGGPGADGGNGGASGGGGGGGGGLSVGIYNLGSSVTQTGNTFSGGSGGGGGLGGTSAGSAGSLGDTGAVYNTRTCSVATNC